jgi:hypothetical protein
VDKHTRPYKCPLPGCKVGAFTNARDLRRHRREVHTSPAFTCPVVICKRYRRGSGRKDNLVQHLKRMLGEDDVIQSALTTSLITNGSAEIAASPNGECLLASESRDTVDDEIDGSCDTGVNGQGVLGC